MASMEGFTLRMLKKASLLVIPSICQLFPSDWIPFTLVSEIPCGLSGLMFPPRPAGLGTDPVFKLTN